MPTSIEDFMKVATEEQKDLLFKLSETAEQEKEYAGKVNRVYGSITRGVYQDSSGVTLCEDGEDAFVISAGLRLKLERVREQMKSYMIKAIDLRMGHLGIIQRNYEHYVGEPLLIK